MKPVIGDRQTLVLGGALLLALALVVLSQYRFKLNWGDKNLTLEPANNARE